MSQYGDIDEQEWAEFRIRNVQSCVPVKECDCRVGPKGQLPGCLASGEVVDDADGAAGPDGVHEGVAEAGDGGEVTTEEEESLGRRDHPLNTI